MVAPYMTKEKIRSRIGNAMTLIIFNDCETVFRPKDLFLGQVSNAVCVVQPQLETEDYRIGFFQHYECKAEAASHAQAASHVASQQLFVMDTLAKWGPVVPAHFFFDKISLSEFVLTKLFNARLRASSHHPQVNKLFEVPVAALISEFVQQHVTERESSRSPKDKDAHGAHGARRGSRGS